MNLRIKKITHIILSGLSSVAIACSGNVFDKMINVDEPDLVSPTVTLSYKQGGNTGGSFKEGEVTITATYSEELATAPLISIDQQGSVDINDAAMTDEGDAKYTYILTVCAADGNLHIDGEVNVSLSATTDLAGNPSAAPSNNTFIIDTVSPTVVITYDKSGDTTSPFGTGDLTITAKYSEPITSAPKIDIENPGFNDESGTMTSHGNGVYTYTYTINSRNPLLGYEDGTAEITLSAVTDAAGNEAGPPSNNTFIIDTTSPKPVITSTVTSPTNGPFEIKIDFVENVTGFTIDEINVTNGSVTAFSGSGRYYYATITPPAAPFEGNVFVALNSGVAVDAAGNNSEASEDFSMEIDLSALTTALSTSTGPYSNSPTFTVAIEFSKDVSDFVQGDITVTNGSVTAFSGSGGTYSATITHSGQGLTTVKVGAGTAHDAASNPNGTSNTISVIYDTDSPTVNITYNKNGNTAGPFNAGEVTITATYSEALAPTTAPPRISINQPGSNDISNASMSHAGGNVYSYTYTIHSTSEPGYDDGTATVSLSATKDPADNISAAPTNNTFVIDTTAPVLNITSPSGSARVNSSAVITFTDSETTNPRVSVDGTNWTDAVSGTTSFGSISQFSGLAEGGEFTLYLRDTDAAGNTGLTNINLIKDTTGPTVAISYDKTGPFSTGDMTITATYSEELAIAPAISIDQPGSTDISGITMTYVSPKVYRYTYTVHAADGSNYMDGTATVSLSATTDLAGNASAAPTNNTFVIDTTAPVVAITSPSNGSSVNDSAVIIFTTDGTSPQFSVNDTTWTTAVSGSTISQFGLPEGPFILYLRDTDAAGNVGKVSINLTKDITAPSVSVSAVKSPTNTNPQFTITFSEEMTEFMQGDITIDSANGSVTSLATSDNIVFTATVTPSVQSGTVTISIGAAVATDLAGNSNFASTATASVIYDGELPAIIEAKTLDTDGNGRIDHYKITFSEAVKESTFVASEWSVAGYSGVALDAGYAGNTATDAVVYISFNEIAAGYDTGVKPDLTSTGSVSLEDLNGNKIAEVQSTSVNETDGASPIIISATGITGTPGLSITFSEEVKAASGSISEDDFDYADVSGNGASSLNLMSDMDGSDRVVSGVLDVNLDLNDLNVDTLGASASGMARIIDYADPGYENYLAASTVTVTGAVAPYVLNAFATADTKIRLYYSEAMNPADATNKDNYSLTRSGGSVTITGITQIDGSIYEITTGSNLASTTTYTLTVTGAVHDLDGVELVNPKFASFLGNEQLTIGAAACITTKSLLVVFNKPVLAGSGSNGGERAGNYRLTGPSTLGPAGNPYTPDTAVRGGISAHNEVTLTHANDQRGVGYMVIGANNNASDGFSDAGYAIQTEVTAEYLQNAPGDRVSWNGCGTEITDFTSPIALDPFGDTSDFGYLVSYGGMVYIGPNNNGNSAARMEASGKNPVNVTYTFAKDSTGTTASNSATGIVSIGHSGCTNNSNDPLTGCGPDNENGRGIFVTGEVNSVTHLFITGARSTGDNDYIYWTADTDSVLDFNYIDGSAPLDALNVGGNKNTESILISGGNVYWMQPGNLRARPYFTRMTLPGAVSNVDIANNATPTSGNGTFMNMRYAEGMGIYATTKKNSADIIGGTVYAFNSYIYVANNGSVRNNSGSYTSLATNQTSANGYRNDGGIVRSTSATPGNSGKATDWADITPGLTNSTPGSNTDYSNYFSIPLGAMGDVIPAQRPIPAFATFNNRLYIIRNACVSNMINGNCVCNDSHTGACTDDIVCPSGSEVPQLWKCDPGADNRCDASEWILVPTGTTKLTNFGNTNNKSITLLVTNGSYLYIGFDNAVDGVKIYRTNVANPTSTADFEQIGASGLGRTDMKEIYSAISVQQGADYYIYVSAGTNNEPVAVYRQKNN